jgi:hypothetical protein
MLTTLNLFASSLRNLLSRESCILVYIFFNEVTNTLPDLFNRPGPTQKIYKIYTSNISQNKILAKNISKKLNF